MMSRKSDFVLLILIAKLSSTKNTEITPPSALARAFNVNNSSTILSFVRKRIESPKNPVTVQNSQPYGQPRPDSIGTMCSERQCGPTRDINGRRKRGKKLN